MLQEVLSLNLSSKEYTCHFNQVSTSPSETASSNCLQSVSIVSFGVQASGRPAKKLLVSSQGRILIKLQFSTSHWTIPIRQNDQVSNCSKLADSSNSDPMLLKYSGSSDQFLTFGICDWRQKSTTAAFPKHAESFSLDLATFAPK